MFLIFLTIKVKIKEKKTRMYLVCVMQIVNYLDMSYLLNVSHLNNISVL